MATSKAKRPILLAQVRPQRRSNPEQILRPKTGSGFRLWARTPAKRLNPKTNPDPAGLIPVKTHVYRTIAELNGGFDKVIQELETLSRVRFFNSDGVTAIRDLICRLRAEANRDFTVAMHERERANAGHLEQQTIRAANHARVI
jgi:hypothetical protein